MNSKNISSLFVAILIIIAATKFIISYNNKKANYTPSFISLSKDLEMTLQKADQAFKDGHNTRALQLYQQALRSSPYNPPLLNQIGIIRLKLRQYDLAENIYQKLIKLAPEKSFFLINLSLSLLYQKKDMEAEIYLQKAISMKTTDSRVFFIRAAMLVRRGDTKGALKEFSNIKDSKTIFRFLLNELFDNIRNEDEFKVFLNKHKPQEKARIKE
jgi:tetratricopeptide (TPR) repeat protein